MPKYRKKPVVIQAMRWNGANVEEVSRWLVWLSTDATAVARLQFDYTTTPPTLRIPTLEGTMTASAGDWIIRGVKGEFYPCNPDIFDATYEPVED